MTDLLRILGYVWVAGMGAIILVAGILIWLERGFAGVSPWAYVVAAAILVPGVVLVVVAGWLDRQPAEDGRRVS